MFCKYCGAQVADNAAFCGKCGKGLPKTAAPSPVGSPMPSAAQATIGRMQTAGAGVVSGNKNVKVIAIAIVAVLVVAIALVFLLGGKGGASSPDKIGDKVGTAMDTLVSSSLEMSDIEKAARDIVDLMPPEAVESSVKNQGFESVDDYFRSTLSSDSAGSLFSALPFGSSDEYRELLSALDISFKCAPGSSLDESELSDINETLWELGVDSKATEGYELDGSITVTATGDNEYGIEKGKTQTETTSTGMDVVKIDGKWYLWTNL